MRVFHEGWLPLSEKRIPSCGIKHGGKSTRDIELNCEVVPKVC